MRDLRRRRSEQAGSIESVTEMITNGPENSHVNSFVITRYELSRLASHAGNFKQVGTCSRGGGQCHQHDSGSRWYRRILAEQPGEEVEPAFWTRWSHAGGSLHAMHEREPPYDRLVG